MCIHKVDYCLPEQDRAGMRKDLISKMLDEIPGTGKGEYSSRYEYHVEKFQDYEIYLKRPTWLNKGFDFTVNIKGRDWYSKPSFESIYAALNDCKVGFPNDYSRVKTAITRIYNCQSIELRSVDGLTFHDSGKEHPIAIILLAIKWLFLEQDCAYWNYSGRGAFYDGLTDRDLA